jgi:hypothetical protein
MKKASKTKNVSKPKMAVAPKKMKASKSIADETGERPEHKPVNG